LDLAEPPLVAAGVPSKVTKRAFGIVGRGMYVKSKNNIKYYKKLNRTLNRKLN
jgi:hypothetical protein